MSELVIDIENLLSQGLDPYTVASALDIPLDWVMTVYEWRNGPDNTDELYADAGVF